MVDSRLQASITAFGGVNPGLATSKCVIATPIDHYSKTDPLPLNGPSIGSQTFIWGTKDGQIVSAGSGRCLTAGNPNMYPHRGNGAGDYTNAFTLEHEVWMGPLTDNIATGGQRQVVVLFNKGSAAESLSAPVELLGNAGATLAVRDVLALKDLAPLAPNSPLVATVPSHGTAVFVVEMTK